MELLPKSWVSHGEFCAAERITEVEFEDRWWKYCRRDDLHEESTYTRRYM